MRRAPLVLGMALLLLAVTASSAAMAQGNGEERRPDGTGQPGRPDGTEDRGASPEQRRAPPVPVGAFEHETDARRAVGEIVSFGYTTTGIQSFSYRGKALYDVTILARDPGEEGHEPRAQPRGGEMRIRMPTFAFTAHDNPTAMGRIETDGTISVAFAEGTIFVREDDRLRFENGGVRGTIRGDDVRITDRTVTARGDLLLFVDAQRGDFDRNRGPIGHAISRGHVGAEASFNARNGDVEQDVMSYGNVTMTTVKAERGNLTLLVDGHGINGRVLVLNVDGRVLGAAKADDLTILFDNITIGPADNLTDILDPDDDGYLPEYYLVFDPGQEAFQLIVTVPHYSVHTLSIMSTIVLPPPSVIVGLVAGIALLVPAGYVLFRRK